MFSMLSSTLLYSTRRSWRVFGHQRSTGWQSRSFRLTTFPRKMHQSCMTHPIKSRLIHSLATCWHFCVLPRIFHCNSGWIEIALHALKALGIVKCQWYISRGTEAIYTKTGYIRRSDSDFSYEKRQEKLSDRWSICYHTIMRIIDIKFTIDFRVDQWG